MNINRFSAIYNKIHKYNLMSLGLWPYQSKLAKWCVFMLFVMSSISLLLPLSAGLSEDWSTDPVTIIENILSIIYIITGLMKYTFLFAQETKLRELYDKITSDWNNLTNNEEIKILQSYTLNGQYITSTYILFGLPAFITYGLITFLPTILNTITVNEYSQVFPYYFSRMIIHEDIRHYQISLHCIVVFFYVGTCYMATSCTFIGSVEHVCGIYAIVCYRLQNAIKINDEKSIVFNLIHAIYKHKDAINCVNIIEQIFSKGFLIVEIGALSAIAIVITDVMWKHDSIRQIFRVILVTFIFLMYIFYINWIGEKIIQVSNDIGSTAYFIDWYLIPIEARELVHMIIRRSCKTEKLTAGSFAILSIRNFGSMLRISWSIATVLISTQRSQK